LPVKSWYLGLLRCAGQALRFHYATLRASRKGLFERNMAGKKKQKSKIKKKNDNVKI